MKCLDSVDPAAENGDVSVNAGVLSLGTSIPPGCCTNDLFLIKCFNEILGNFKKNLVVVFDWATGVALACVFATTADTSAEHAFKNSAVVTVSSVTIVVCDNVDIYAV